jgi:hypothetical protein
MKVYEILVEGKKYIVNPDDLERIRLKEDDTQQQQDDQQQDNTQQAPTQDNTQQQTDDAQSEQSEQSEDNSVAVDSTVDSGEQVAAAAQAQQSTGDAPMKMPAIAPMPAGISSQGAPLELGDGTSTDIAQDSSLQYDAIKPEGEASISFASGNFEHISELPQSINQKVITITKTIMPLAEAGLIELLDNNKAYKGQDFQASFDMSPDGQPTFEVHAQYKVENWIGTDVPQEDIAEDAKYLLSRLKVVPNVQWTECTIDCTEGTFKLGFII